MGVSDGQCAHVQAFRNAIAGELNHRCEIHRILVNFVALNLAYLDLHQVKPIVKMF
jgi:hypothetical protein